MLRFPQFNQLLWSFWITDRRTCSPCSQRANPSRWYQIRLPPLDFLLMRPVRPWCWRELWDQNSRQGHPPWFCSSCPCQVVSATGYYYSLLMFSRTSQQQNRYGNISSVVPSCPYILDATLSVEQQFKSVMKCCIFPPLQQRFSLASCYWPHITSLLLGPVQSLH